MWHLNLNGKRRSDERGKGFVLRFTIHDKTLYIHLLDCLFDTCRVFLVRFVSTVARIRCALCATERICQSHSVVRWRSFVPSLRSHVCSTWTENEKQQILLPRNQSMSIGLHTVYHISDALFLRWRSIKRTEWITMKHTENRPLCALWSRFLSFHDLLHWSQWKRASSTVIRMQLSRSDRQQR